MDTVGHRSPPTSDALAVALARPEAYGGQTGAVEVRETHISWVFLAGDRAYKLKKPVILPFVDYGTAPRRREMCEEEVRLNRRLAPDVYLGTRAVIPTAEGVVLAPAGHPDAIDHVVEMRRFDEARTLAARVLHGGEYLPALVAVGRCLAEFHADAAAPAAEHATAALHAALAQNIDTLLALAPDREFACQVAAPARFTEAFVAARRGELEARAATGRVRDGHGDLRAEHVLLEHGVEVVDCLEFDPALRIADVGCDLAFLIMDLEALGSRVAARAVLDGYRDAGGDPGDDALLAFFAVYRALVRAKVSLVRATQSADRQRLVDYARARGSHSPSASRGARGSRASSSSRGCRPPERRTSPQRSPTARTLRRSTPTRCASACSVSPRPRAPVRRRTPTASTAAPTRSSAGWPGASSIVRAA
jgi:aminoglycoside phosphotransferase family enzyme